MQTSDPAKSRKVFGAQRPASKNPGPNAFGAKTSGPNASGPRALPRLIDRLDRLAAERDEISLDNLVQEIGIHGHAPLLMVVALLMILPLGMIPGVGGALGLIAALIGLQMLIGGQRVALPGFIGRRKIPSDRLRKFLARIRPTTLRMSLILKVRLEPLAVSRPAVTLIGLALIVAGLSLLIIGAIPVATPLLGLPVAIFSVGLLTRDGMAVAGGWILLGAAAMTIFAAGQTLAG